jgi:uncharacterized membrane protein
MRYPLPVTSSATLALSLLLSTSAFASDASYAQQLCEDKIRDVYGVSKLRDVWTDQIGNSKFKVYGKVKANSQLYPFDCKVKHGQVQSYSYEGPHDRHTDDSDRKVGTAVAVGAGLAIIAAIAASQSGDNEKAKSTGTGHGRSQAVLEDDCHDAVEARVRHDQERSARVALRNSRVSGDQLFGEATVTYGDRQPHLATFTCYLDSYGRVVDSSYQLY